MTLFFCWKFICFKILLSAWKARNNLPSMVRVVAISVATTTTATANIEISSTLLICFWPSEGAYVDKESSNASILLGMCVLFKSWAHIRKRERWEMSRGETDKRRTKKKKKMLMHLHKWIGTLYGYFDLIFKIDVQVIYLFLCFSLSISFLLLNQMMLNEGMQWDGGGRIEGNALWG